MDEAGGRLSKDFLQELSWITNVTVENVAAFLGITTRYQGASESGLKYTILERLAQTYGHVIWVQMGHAFEPRRKEIEANEQQSAYLALHGDQEGARQKIQMVLESYAQGRRSLLRLAQEAALRGPVILAVTPSKHEQDRAATPDIVEAYSGRAGIDYLQQLLDCRKSSRRCPRRAPSIEASAYDFYPFDPASRSICHSDVMSSCITNALLIPPVVDTAKEEGGGYRGDGVRSDLRAGQKKAVAIGVPITSHGLGEGEKMAFLTALLPSLLETVSMEELSAVRLTFYLAFDEGDAFFEEEAVRRSFLKDAFRQIADRPIEMKLYRVPRVGRVALLWNILYNYALQDGNDYFYQVNDDLTIKSAGWLSSFIETLDSHGGYGVVGPADSNHGWNCTLLTQAMVTRTHHDIFGSLYPVEIKNWTSDRWITEVYAQSGGTYCDRAIVAANGKAGRRYNACDFLNWMIYVEAGRLMIDAWRLLMQQQQPQGQQHPAAGVI